MTKSKNFKKSLQIFIIFALVVSLITPFSINSATAAEFIETFDNQTSNGTSYVNGSFEGINGVTWTYSGGRGNLDKYPIEGTGLMFRDAASYIESSVIQDGISTLSFDYKTAFTSTGARQFEVYINGVLKGTTPAIDTDNTSTNTYKLENINVEGPFTIKLVKVGSNRQVTIDNITWTSFEGSELGEETQVKAVTATPATGSIAAGTPVSLTTTTEGATIYYTTDGLEPTIASTVYTGPITINEPTTIKAIAVKEGLTDSAVSTFEYTIAVESTVISIEQARSVAGTDQTVQIQGTVTTKPGSWGAKGFYLQDETAGIYVYAPTTNIVASNLNIGDIVKISGKTSLYNGEIQFNSPSIESVSSGTKPIAEKITLPIVNDETQGELVNIENVSIKELAATNNYGTFEFKAVDSSNNEILVRHDNRTGYDFSNFEADGFNNNDIVTLTGIVSKFNGTYQLKTLGAESFELVTNFVPTQVANIIATPAPGAVFAGTKVELKTETPNSTIYYTTDGSEPSKASNVYNPTAGIVVNEAMTIKAFATSINLDDSTVAEFAYTISTPPSTISIADARAKELGEEVTVTGIVTALLETATAHIQDENGSAIAIYPASSLSANVGDKITVKGKVAEYSGLRQLTNIQLVGAPVPSTLPEPLVIASTGVAEENESRLVTIKDVSIKGSGRDFIGTDANGQFAIYDKTEDSGLNDGITYSEITGIVGQYGTTMQILPTQIIQDASKVQDIQASHSGGVTSGTKVSLTTITQGATIYYTTDGSEPTTNSTVYSSEITVNEPMTIKAIAIKDGLIPSSIAIFTYEIIDTAGASISDIQGATHSSPYLNLTVQDVEGVVTFVIDSSNFIMQEADNSTYDNVKSNAIKVNKSSHGVSVGDAVKVTGDVVEEGGNSRLKDTRINASEVNKTGIAALPEILVIGTDLMPPNKIIDNDQMTIFAPHEDGIDFWESIEYMRVSFQKAKIVGPPYNNDVPIVAPGTTNNTFNVNGGLNIAADDYNPEKIMLEGVSGKDYQSGDQFNEDLIGYVENFSDGYRLNTNKVFPAVTKANIQQEVTHIEPAADKLTIAAYNIENFSNNISNTPDSKVAKIAQTFVTNMKSPDIITLVEVQDNDGQIDSGNADASESYKRLIEAIKVAGGPTYQWTDVTPINNTVGGAPGGNIRIGYIYNPERVTLVAGTKGTGAEANTWTEEGNLALNPGFIDPTKFPDTRKPIAAEFEFNGERVVVIGTHLNSKGGDQSLWGTNQPPKLTSEAERLSLATAINAFIDEGLEKNPNLNIVLAGDMNDFEFTPVLETLKGGVLTNMVDLVPVEDRFSYFFQGNNQVLDHILVSNNLVNATKADMIHINANFTESQGQASDHDPVLVQIDLKAATKAEKVYNLTNFKTKKLTITKPSVKVNLTGTSLINEGLVFTGSYIELTGTGFATHTVIIQPKEAGGIVDLKGTEAKELIIDGNKVKEIRGAENVQSIKYIEGTNGDNVIISNSGGSPIGDPSLPSNDYYINTQGKTGAKLKSSLHEIISEHEVLTYSEVWEALKITDEDPNNPNNVLLFYSGISRSKNANGGDPGEWNREHVWAKSHGEFGTSMGPGTDIHHLRATDVQVNSSRSNLDFDNGGNSINNCTGCFKDNDSFEPPNHVKGDVARMLFYMAVRYEQGDKVDLELNNNVNNGSNPYHGKISVLLEWHKQDPVDELEKNRNEKIYLIQGNRNPFIDNPEWATMIWAN